jgi:hypothetical protein
VSGRNALTPATEERPIPMPSARRISIPNIIS